MPEPSLIAIGQKDEWINAVSGANTVGVFRRLAFTFQRTAGGALGLDDGQRPAIRLEKDVVGYAVISSGFSSLADAGSARKIGFLQHGTGARRPTRARQLEVNECAGLPFGVLHEVLHDFLNR